MSHRKKNPKALFPRGDSHQCGIFGYSPQRPYFCPDNFISRSTRTHLLQHDIFLHQNGAPLHYAAPIRAYLDEFFESVDNRKMNDELTK